MVLTDLLEKRRSVRQFSRQEVQPAVVEAILEAGRLAPSGATSSPGSLG